MHYTSSGLGLLAYCRPTYFLILYNLCRTTYAVTPTTIDLILGWIFAFRCFALAFLDARRQYRPHSLRVLTGSRSNFHQHILPRNGHSRAQLTTHNCIPARSGHLRLTKFLVCQSARLQIRLSCHASLVQTQTNSHSLASKSCSRSTMSPVL